MSDDKINPRTERMDALYGILSTSPDGLTVQDMADELECHVKSVKVAISDLRLIWTADEDVNLVCDPNGYGQQWLYHLVGTYDGAREWAVRRTVSIDSQVKTLSGVMGSMVAATNGRTIEGRKARVYKRGMDRMIEDIEDLMEKI